MTSTTITARAVVAGLHHWPDAPERRAYLAEPHRHEFHFSACVRVGHNERDVEFHDLGDLIEASAREYGGEFHPDALLVDFGSASCETLAHHVYGCLVGRGLSVVWVEVSEDGQFSARVG